MAHPESEDPPERQPRPWPGQLQLNIRASQRLAVAAGALSAIRSGLGSGVGEDIERIVQTVEVREVANRAN